GCESLLEVDSSIFLLQKLQVLHIGRCTSLKSLSSNTCSPVLTELNAWNCINLQEFSVTFASVDGLALGLTKWNGNELSSSILHKKNLRCFYFPLIECLVDLPENFANYIWLESPLNLEHDPFITLRKLLSSPAFISLKHLTLANIPILSEIPDNFSLLASLESLTLIDIAIRSLPETKYLPRLNWLRVYGCKMLQSIPALSQYIPFFVVWNCESLQTVLSSTCQHDKPNPCFTVLLNCQNLDPQSYHAILKDAIDGIELVARKISKIEEDDIIEYLLPVMPGGEYWFHYRSTQVSFTLELPPNLLGFVYYLVLSQGHMNQCVGFGCDCYLANSSGESIYITSYTRAEMIDYLGDDSDTKIRMESDHVLLWYDPVI
ncbi:TIR-NBS-LRR resistance protein, partial [Trifolium medium]|nr:TIR-NBS-LRR resistance protein [Trifolium medium]